MMTLLFGGVQLARVFYTYHALQKALRGGAGLAARSVSVNYCDTSDVTIADVRNFIVYGNLQGEGQPIVTGLTPDMIQILPERNIPEPPASPPAPAPTTPTVATRPPSAALPTSSS